tara:strand:+ start:193360 stop:193860 length:501 start_codon:yes stop_codon:yes gene_type:complete
MIADRISSTFQTAAQGLAVQRERINIASQNIANARTSSPVGSTNVYRPKTVQTIGPEQSDFMSVLKESVSGLKTTNSKHLGSNADLLNQDKGPVGLGPDYVVAEEERFRYEYDPNHPDADENGMVRYPDVDMVQEMAELVSANRLYEANLSSIQAEKEMIKRSMEI